MTSTLCACYIVEVIMRTLDSVIVLLPYGYGGSFRETVYMYFLTLITVISFIRVNQIMMQDSCINGTLLSQCCK